MDLVNRIEYAVTSNRLDPGSGSRRSESILINGKAYMKKTISGGEPPVSSYHIERESEEIREYEYGVWVFDGEVKSWDPFGSLGGLPWRREDAEDQFDEVELVEVGRNRRATGSSLPRFKDKAFYSKRCKWSSNHGV